MNNNIFPVDGPKISIDDLSNIKYIIQNRKGYFRGPVKTLGRIQNKITEYSQEATTRGLKYNP